MLEKRTVNQFALFVISIRYILYGSDTSEAATVCYIIGLESHERRP